jgi:hypothetical protein
VWFHPSQCTICGVIWHIVHNNCKLTLNNGTYVEKSLPNVKLQLLGIVCHNKHRIFYIIMDEIA